MIYVVHGAGGAQGGPVVAELENAGHATLTNAGRAGVLRFDSADLLAEAYGAADGVFVHLPIGDEEGRRAQARTIVEAVERGRPARVVISTSGALVDRVDGEAAGDAAIASLIRGVEGSGVSTAVVAPRLYLENLLLPPVLGPVRDAGTLPYALRDGFRVSWSSHDDVAAVVSHLLTDHAVTGTVGVGHLPGLTGDDLAAAFTEHLGREVSYDAQTPEQFGATLEPIIGPGAAGVVALYRQLAAMPENTIAEETSAQRLLGIEPLPISQWVARAVA